ncbi:MAG: hypothetical protein JWM68_620 [Verrucomicrobiales bacterium]|nr:hypothetical protein [Verrucomicrobiales bacterium]
MQLLPCFWQSLPSLSKKQSHIGPWESIFRTLRTFQRMHGHCDVPSKGGHDGLYLWLKKQRQSYAAGGLGSYQRDKLKAIGALPAPTAGQERYDAIWESNFEQLKRFKKGFGHCNVPARWPKDPKLGSWVYTQRGLKKKGQLRPERVQQLEKLGFKWSVEGFEKELLDSGSHYQAHVKGWEKLFQRLKKWKSKGFIIPMGVDETLRRWAIIQRNYHREGTLPANRQARLESIGFPWKLPKMTELTWAEMFQRVVKFKKRFGHPNVPGTWTEDDSLGNWTAFQRSLYRKGRLEMDRIRKLEALGFSWKRPDGRKMRLTGSHNTEHEERWEKNFRALKKWKDKDFAIKVEDDSRLFRWVNVQREVYRAGLMRPDRQQRLEAIGFRLKRLAQRSDKKWEAKFNLLVRFKKEFNHFEVPTTLDRQLHNWVQRQRKHRKAGRLAKERVRGLESIGFDWTPTLEQTWEELFSELCKWKSKGFKVPVKVQPLQTWANEQRRMHRKGRLRPDRRRRLKEIGFPFEV